MAGFTTAIPSDITAGIPTHSLLIDTTFPGEMDVCWYHDATQLRCDRHAGADWGTIPSTATNATVAFGIRVPSDYLLLFG